MAGQIKDYLPTLAADYTTSALIVKPRHTLVESGNFRQENIEFDDGAITTVTFSTTPRFFIRMSWDVVSASDAETILDFYFDVNKAKGMARSFKLLHPVSGVYYTVKFASEISRETFTKNPWRSVPQVIFRVLGYYT